ncbi:MAG: site-specific integrase, partial [Mediterraneibacter faecis]
RQIRLRSYQSALPVPRILVLCNHLQNVVATTYIFRLQLSTFIFYNKQQKAQEYIKQIQRINKETGESYQDFLFVKDGYLINPNKLYNIIKDACNRCINIPIKGTHRIRKTFVSTLVNNGVPITTASRIAGHADERTTIKNYLFDTNDETETNKAILNALGDNPESSVTTTYRNVENKNVTKRDSNIILFPSNKKAENPCFTRISH